MLDFSDDNDRKADQNSEFTGASLKAGALPENFSICSAFMTEAWNTLIVSVRTFMLLDDFGHSWGRLMIYAAEGFTEYDLRLGYDQFVLTRQIPGNLFPFQWTYACVSVDSMTRKVTLVVDGKFSGGKEYTKEVDDNRPAIISILLGYNPATGGEQTGKITNLNVFNSTLTVERMKKMTMAGGEECGAPGDLLNWEEAEWTLHSEAKVIKVDREWEGPCRRESQVQVFMASFYSHQDCMQHCQKIGSGRSPSVRTREEWENLTNEIDLIAQDPSDMRHNLWLSATEGDKFKKLEKLDHWPENEIVNNETIKLEAQETVWRDYYNGRR